MLINIHCAKCLGIEAVEVTVEVDITNGLGIHLVGLADVAGSLPKALKAAGAKVAVIIPKYGTIPEEYTSKMQHIAEFYVPLAWRSVYCGIDHLQDAAHR